MAPTLEERLQTRLVKGIYLMRLPENPTPRWLNYLQGYGSPTRRGGRGPVGARFTRQGPHRGVYVVKYDQGTNPEEELMAP